MGTSVAHQPWDILSKLWECMQKPDWMAWKRSISGGTAGALAKTLVAPLERMRTIAMASPAGMSISQALKTAWSDGGALGLFKGNMATILKAVPGTATQFSTYHGMKEHLNCAFGLKTCDDEEENILVHMIAGAFAGAVECTVTHPLETVRTILSMPTGDTRAQSIMGVRINQLPSVILFELFLAHADERLVCTCLHGIGHWCHHRLRHRHHTGVCLFAVYTAIKA